MASNLTLKNPGNDSGLMKIPSHKLATVTLNYKIYSTLSSLKFYRHSLNLSLKTQLIKTLALPHFDYASILFKQTDKTRAKTL